MCYCVFMEMSELKRIVEASGYKISFLAEKIGVKATTLRRCLSGKQQLGKSAQLLLLKYLNKESLLKKAS